MLTYQDYVKYKNSTTGEAGNGAISEEAWKALSQKEQWNNMQGGMLIAKDDSRYGDLAKQLGIGNGSSIMVNGGEMAHAGDSKWYNDPKAVVKGDGWNATGQENQTPFAQQQANASGLNDKTWNMIAASIVTAGAGAALSGAGAGVSGSQLAAAGGEGFGTAVGGTASAFTEGGLAGAGAGGGAGTGSTPGLTGEGNTPGWAQEGGATPGGEPFEANYPGNAPIEGGAGSSSNLLQQANRFRQYFNGARSILNSFGGGSKGGSSSGGSGMGFDIGSLLNAFGLGRSVFGRGVGTASGATDVGNRAADRSDPWGASGGRDQARGMLTPDVMARLSGLNANGTRSDITNDPAYKFTMEQGIGAINQGDAAQGSLHSGNRLTELERFGAGTAAQFEGQFRGENLSSLNALGTMAGVGSSSPQAAGSNIMSAFEGASTLQNNGLNSLLGNLFGGGLNGQGNSLLGMLGQGAKGIGNWINSLFGSGDTPMTGPDPGFDPNDYTTFADDGSSLADATGAFF